MIIYSFVCINHHEFERFLPMNDRDIIQYCPICNETALRIITPCVFMLDGCSGDFPTAYDKWTKDYYHRLHRSKTSVKEDGTSKVE